MPKKGRSAGAKGYDLLALPTVLLSALEALYGHYQKTFELWENAGIGVPPVFIVVCNNTSTISGFHRENERILKTAAVHSNLPSAPTNGSRRGIKSEIFGIHPHAILL